MTMKVQQKLKILCVRLCVVDFFMRSVMHKKKYIYMWATVYANIFTSTLPCLMHYFPKFIISTKSIFKGPLQ